MVLSLVTAPIAEPLTLSEVKAHCRVDWDDENELLTAFNTAATEYAENFTHRALMPQTWDVSFDELECELWIPKPPLQLTTPPVVTYIDMAGVSQTLSTSLYDLKAPAGKFAGKALISRGYQKVYPLVRSQPNAVTIRFTAGYTNAAAVPGSIKAAIKLLIGNWYANREASQIIRGSVDVLAFGVDSLLWPFKAF